MARRAALGRVAESPESDSGLAAGSPASGNVPENGRGWPGVRRRGQPHRPASPPPLAVWATGAMPNPSVIVVRRAGKLEIVGRRPGKVVVRPVAVVAAPAGDAGKAGRAA